MPPYINNSPLQKIMKDLSSNISNAIRENDRNNISGIINDTLAEANQIFYNGFPEDSKKLLSHLLNEITRIKNTPLVIRNDLAKLYYELGRVNIHLGKSDVANSYFSNVLETSEENVFKRLLNWFDRLLPSKSEEEQEYSRLVVDIMNASALGYRRKRNKASIDSCYQMASQALKEARKIEYQKGEIQSLLILAYVYFYRNEMEQLAENANQSLLLLEQLPTIDYNLFGEANVIKFIENFSKGELNEALRFGEQAKEAYEEAGNILELPNVYRHISQIKRRQGEYFKALDYLKLILSDYQNIISESNRFITYLSIGNIYYELADLDRALHYYQLAEKMRPEPNQGRAAAISSIARVLHLQGNLPEAENLLKESIKIYDKLPYLAEGRYSAYLNYFQLLIDRYELEEESNYYLQEAENQLEKIKKQHRADSIYSTVMSLISEAIFEKTRGNLFNATTRLQEAEKIAKENADQNSKLLNDVQLVISQVYLEQYKLSKKKDYFQKTAEYLVHAENSAKQANLFAVLIDIKKIQAELAIIVNDWENASIFLDEALQIITEKDLTVFKKEIVDKKLYIEAAKKVEIQSSREIDVDTALQSIRFAQGLPSKEIMEVPKFNIDKIALVSYYLDSTQGTKKCASIIPDNFSQEIPNIDMVLTNQGTITMVLLGQGESYTEGLYILPCGKEFVDYDKFVYSRTITNPKDTDLRGKEAAYTIVELFFPNHLNSLFTRRKEQINDIFDDFFDRISNVESLTDEFLDQIKTEIGKLFIKTKR